MSLAAAPIITRSTINTPAKRRIQPVAKPEAVKSECQTQVYVETRLINGVPTRVRVTRVKQSGLTIRGRRVVALLALIPIIAAMVLVGPRIAHAASAQKTAVIKVHSGETLWELATRVDPKADPREVMYEIQKLNDLNSPDLVAGQGLVVPVR